MIHAPLLLLGQTGLGLQTSKILHTFAKDTSFCFFEEIRELSSPVRVTCNNKSMAHNNRNRIIFFLIYWKINMGHSKWFNTINSSLVLEPLKASFLDCILLQGVKQLANTNARDPSNTLHLHFKNIKYRGKECKNQPVISRRVAEEGRGFCCGSAQN